LTFYQKIERGFIMTRNVGLSEFIDDYVGGALLLALVISCGIFFLGSLFEDDFVSEANNKKNFYLALEEKKVDDTLAVKAAKVIKTALRKIQDAGTVSEKIAALKKISKLKSRSSGSNFYANLFYKNSDKIIGAINGQNKDLSASIHVPKWRNFFLWCGLIIFIVFSLFTTITFCWKSIEEGESLLTWPWDEPWVYFFLLFMFPCLFPCALIEVCYRLLTASFSKLSWSRTGSEHKVRQVKQENRKKEQEKKKKEALAKIEEVKKQVEKAKQEYAVNCRGEANAEKSKKLTALVVESKRQLSGLGVQLEMAQIGFAQAKKELSEWEEVQAGEGGKIRENSFRDFERLKAMEHVAAVKVEDNELIVYTDAVLIKYLCFTYEIGIIAISINMMTGHFSLCNLCSTHPEGNTHPYGSHGNICWGSLGVSINTALAQKEFPSAVQFMLAALYSADGDKPAKVKEWRKV
jgi:flagellar biosynthesis GTPase FlhF